MMKVFCISIFISMSFIRMTFLSSRSSLLIYWLQELIDYYNCSTKRDWARRPVRFEATGSIANGLAPTLYNSAPQVALFSSRGPGVKDFSFQDADVLKPDILAPGNLIWAAWAPNGTDEANYVGKINIKKN